MTDLHSHLIPGVDDGASDERQAARAVAALVAEGITAIATTPHVDGSITVNPAALEERLREIDTGWDVLVSLAGASLPDLKLSRAAEIMLDIPEPDLSEPKLRIAGGQFALVEFPYMTIPPNSDQVIARVRSSGWIPLIAHPERYHNVVSEHRMVPRWRDCGAYLQMNGPSLLGRYGESVKQMAVSLLEDGLVDCVASDYHARGEPHVRHYCAALTREATAEQVDLLTEVNPSRILRGELPIPIGSSRRRGFWSKLAVWR
jgi:protein-tyrosine phosphatase